MDQITLNVKFSNDTKLTILIPKSSTIFNLKELINQQSEDTPVKSQRLIFAGKVLKDDEIISNTKLVDQSTQQPASSTSNDTTNANTTTSQQPPLPNLFSQPPPPQTGANPDMFQTMMQGMMSNPQLMQEVLQNNPQSRAMGLTPESLSAMLSNPQMQQMMQQMIANPESLRQLSGMMPSNLAGINSGVPQQQQQSTANQQPPEVRFEQQLKQMNEMGFYEADKNVRALLATNGNVNLAVEYLFNNPN